MKSYIFFIALVTFIADALIFISHVPHASVTISFITGVSIGICVGMAIKK